MITKGVSQEQKPPLLVNIRDTKFTSATPQTVYKRKHDFTKIDYLFYVVTGQLSGAGGGTSHVTVDIGGSEYLDSTITTGSTNYNKGLIDCTSLTGVLQVEVQAYKQTDNLEISTIYLGVVDA